MKIEINGKLPKGFKLVNGKVVRTMSTGGTVNKTLAPIPRDQANLEAEKGETALTDLTNDGSFELYNIGGKRHTDGGTPLNLPEQSFVFSDTKKMKLTIEELESLGIKSKKKLTPAEVSKKFPLNEYIEILNDETSDKISIDTAEEMIEKNKIKLSQLAFIQESKKDFADGLPLASYPFLISKGINPQELEAKIAEKNGPQQNPPMSQEQMAMGPAQGNLQQFTGPPQGGMPPMGPPMGKYGTELPSYQNKGEIPTNEKLLRDIRKVNLELEGILPADIDSVETVRYMQEIVPKLKKRGFSTWDVIRYLQRHRPDLLEYRDNGALYNIKGLEGVGVEKSGLPNKQKYGSELPQAMFGMAGLKYMNPFMKNKEEKLKEDMGNMMSMGTMFAGAQYGTELPKAQWGNLGKYISSGWKAFKNTPSTINKAIPPVINPTAFNLKDNWAYSVGPYSPKITTTKLNLGDENIGLLNRETYPFTVDQSNKFGNYLNQRLLTEGTSRVDRMENVKVWDEHQGYGIATSLYDKSLQGTSENFMPGLISGDQKINPMEAPEKTVGLWKYFNKERATINENTPAFATGKDRLWQDAGDEDFSKYLVTDEKTGAVTYTGPEVRLLDLNDAGKAKVEQTMRFYKQLELERMGTGPGGSSPILNWETTTQEASPIDRHSPILRALTNRNKESMIPLGINLDFVDVMSNGFKTSFGREPRIGTGKKLADYNKASLYLLLAMGTFAYFNQDKISKPKEKEKWDKFVEKEALQFKFIKEDGSADIDAYQHWIDIGSPEDSLPAAYEKPKYQNIEDSLEDGLDIGGMKYGGAISPFKADALRKFTGGGPVHPDQLLYGAPPGERTISGGIIPEVDIWDQATPKIGPGEQLLMDMGEQRRLLLESYAGIKDRTDKNPNILEDPEEGNKIQYQINQIEEQIAAIDAKTSTIEQQLLQEKLQLDPFSENGQTPVARYGGSLPKFQNKGETYKEFIERTNRPVQKGIPMDAVYDDSRGAFISTEMIDKEQKSSDSSFTYRDKEGNIVDFDPYYRPNRSIIDGVDVGEFLVDPDTGDIIMEDGKPKKNPNYNEELFTKGNLGADNHADFYNVMRQDAFANVRKGWLKSSFDEIAKSKTPDEDKFGKDAVKAHGELKALAIAAKNNPGGVEEQQLFAYFNNMNRLLQMSAKTGRTYSNTTREVEKHAKALGLPVPTQLEIMAFQGMYGGLARTKETGSDAEKALLKQVQTQFGADEVGANKVGEGFVSNIDGWIGATSGEQFVGVVGNTEVEHKLKEFKVACKGKEREAKMKECQDKTEKAIAAGETKRFRFDPETCECKAYETPPEIETPEKPRYETFVQDDMAVQVKSGQFPDLINPTRQATPDPAMVDPMYVDPRQSLSTLEATAAAALRAGADPTVVMGSLQDQSEKVINKHEALNTKIYNNAMNINVPALQQFTRDRMENEKQYMDEATMAMANYQTEYKDAEDALLAAEQNQMSNADEMYIRNLENPNYWFSPQDHNIHFYNEKNVDGSITPGPVTYEKALEMCKNAGFTPEHGLNKCINDRMAGGGQSPINTGRPSDEVITSLGTEVKGFSKRQADLQRSRKKLNKWITGH